MNALPKHGNTGVIKPDMSIILIHSQISPKKHPRSIFNTRAFDIMSFPVCSDITWHDDRLSLT
jgi:hypothetical protein